MMNKNTYIDFKRNSNPFGPPLWLKEYLAECLDDAIDYPDHQNIELNQAISEFLGIAVDYVSTANGSLEAIFLVPKLVDMTKTTIIEPTYWGYGVALQSYNMSYNKIILEEASDFNFDLDLLHRHAKKSTLMFICNPNNPTGTYINKSDILKLISENPECHFFVDESHQILKKWYKEQTLANEVKNLHNLTIIYSTSKIFNVGGLRTGIVVSNKNLIQKYRETQIIYSTTTITQRAFVKMLRDKDFVVNMREKLDVVSKEFFAQLKQFDWLDVKDTITNFVLCKIETDSITAKEFADRLMQDGFGIRECSRSYKDLQGEWLRITSNTPENNAKLIKQIKSYRIL